MRILIKQNGKKTQVLINEKIFFEGGRVEAKKIAQKEKEKTGFPLFNVKENGAIVRVN